MTMKLVDAEQLEADLTSVANTIRANTGNTDTLTFPDGFVNAVDSMESVDSALSKLEYLLSDGYKDYSHYFHEKQITEVPRKIFRYTINSTNFQYCFYGCKKLTTLPPLYVSNGVEFQLMFTNCAVTTIPLLNTVKGTNFDRMFAFCNTKTIEGIDISKATNITGMFYGCPKLENIAFNGVIKITGLDLSDCTLLTHDSLMSTINALYDWASAGSTSTYTLTLGVSNLEKLTYAEKAIATRKGWTLR